MEMADKGTIFKIERCCTHDGPGIRTVVFFQGCPLRCGWCANIEGVDKGYTIMYEKSRCVFCYRCHAVCPTDKIHNIRNNGVYAGQCLGDSCRKCVDACLTGALLGSGTQITADELMKIVVADRQYYEESGGGVTFSGGEVLMQPNFLKTMLVRSKNAYLDTAIETSCYARTDVMMELLPYIDHVIMDIKHMDSALHKKHTSVPNELILENAKRIAQAGKDLTISFPLIPGVNDDEANIHALGAFVRDALKAVKDIKQLPYHNYGEIKYDRLGKEYAFKNVKRHSPEQLQRTKQILETYVERVILRA